MKVATSLFFLLILAGSAAGQDPPPTPFEQRKSAVRKLMEAGKWPEARQLAETLNREMPDDLETYALLAVAHRHLGNLAGAEEAVQWMLDLRPESPLSLAAAAELRLHYQEYDGAIQFLNEAYRRTPRHQTAARARILALAAKAYQAAGKAETAKKLERLLEEYK